MISTTYIHKNILGIFYIIITYFLKLIIYILMTNFDLSFIDDLVFMDSQQTTLLTDLAHSIVLEKLIIFFSILDSNIKEFNKVLDLSIPNYNHNIPDIFDLLNDELITLGYRNASLVKIKDKNNTINDNNYLFAYLFLQPSKQAIIEKKNFNK